jgi:hypothetical protein
MRMTEGRVGDLYRINKTQFGSELGGAVPASGGEAALTVWRDEEGSLCKY